MENRSYLECLGQGMRFLYQGGPAMRPLLIAAFVLALSALAAPPPDPAAALARVAWFAQSCVKVTGRQGVIFVDPFKVPPSEGAVADLVLITHPHFDHYEKEAILRVAKPGAPIYGPSEAVKDFGAHAVLAEAGKAYTAAGFSFRAVPAYNLSKSYHPKASGWVGYVLLVDGDSYYFAGDTDFIPEMKGLSPTVAFLPIGGTYTMDAAEAAAAAKAVGAAVTVPYHWGTLEGVGTIKDAEAFKKAAGVRVEILQRKG